MRLTRTPTDTTSRVLTSQHIRSELLPLSFVRLNILTASRWVSKTPSILAIVQQLQPKEISDEPRANEPYTNTTNTRQHQWCRRSLEHCDVCMTDGGGCMFGHGRANRRAHADHIDIARTIRSTDDARSIIPAYGLESPAHSNCNCWAYLTATIVKRMNAILTCTSSLPGIPGHRPPPPQRGQPYPKIYRMRIFAPNDVVAKSRFWYFLGKLRKIKKANGEIISLNQVRSIEEIELGGLGTDNVRSPRSAPRRSRTSASGSATTRAPVPTTCTRSTVRCPASPPSMPSTRIWPPVTDPASGRSRYAAARSPRSRLN